MDKLFLADRTQKSLKNLIAFKFITTDNHAFRLHYRATCLILIVFSLLVTGTQFFGDPIRCIQRDDIPPKVINTFCWIEGTYSLPKAFNKTVGKQVPYPGIDKTEEGDAIVEHAYYQWVCFVLFLQGLCFYFPRLLWKIFEKHKIRFLVGKLYNPVRVDQSHIDRLAEYFWEDLHRHDWYAVKYLLCEIVNFINVILQIFLVDIFLGGTFSTYGFEVIKFSGMEQEARLDPMIRVFPRMTKCRFHRFGSSGDVQTHDAFCLLPLNIVNEKIYIMLWFWFVILAIISVISVIYRLVLMFSKDARKGIFYITRVNKIREIDSIIRVCNYGDWFLLRQLSKNMRGLNFRRFITALVRLIEENPEVQARVPGFPITEKEPLMEPGDDSTLKVGEKTKEI